MPPFGSPSSRPRAPPSRLALAAFAPARLGAQVDPRAAPLPAASSSGVAGPSPRRAARGALVVRNDAIDDAAALASAGPNTVTGPVASEVVPKLPRSDCTRTVKKEEGFDLATTSFGTIGLSVGLPLLVYGFFSFFNFIPGGSVSSLLLIYGFIISLIGFALKYAQLVGPSKRRHLRGPRGETQTTAILSRCATTSPATDTATSSTSRRRSR